MCETHLKAVKSVHFPSKERRPIADSLDLIMVVRAAAVAMAASRRRKKLRKWWTRWPVMLREELYAVPPTFAL